MQWWEAFSSCMPLKCDFDNLNTAKTIMYNRGGKLKEFLCDGFSLENDEEWCIQRDKETKARLAKKQKAHNEKLAKEAAEKERLENATSN